MERTNISARFDSGRNEGLEFQYYFLDFSLEEICDSHDCNLNYHLINGVAGPVCVFIMH